MTLSPRPAFSWPSQHWLQLFSLYLPQGIRQAGGAGGSAGRPRGRPPPSTDRFPREAREAPRPSIPSHEMVTPAAGWETASRRPRPPTRSNSKRFQTTFPIPTAFRPNPIRSREISRATAIGTWHRQPPLRALRLPSLKLVIRSRPTMTLRPSLTLLPPIMTPHPRPLPFILIPFMTPHLRPRPFITTPFITLRPFPRPFITTPFITLRRLPRPFIPTRCAYLPLESPIRAAELESVAAAITASATCLVSSRRSFQARGAPAQRRAVRTKPLL